MREELTTAEVAERNQRGYSYQRGKPVWKTDLFAEEGAERVSAVQADV